MNNATKLVIETLESMAESSRLCQEMAADTADSETARQSYAEDGDTIADAYVDAISAVEAGDLEEALEELETARSLEAKGGDDQHARTSIGAVQTLIENARWAKRVPELTVDLRFHIPPICQGQIVEHAYACDGDYIYERILDRSDRSETIVVYEHPETGSEFEPWNGIPATGDQVACVEVTS